MTALADWVGSYLMMRRALGYQLVRDEGLLDDFTAWLEQTDDGRLTVDAALAWATAPAGASQARIAYRLSTVRRFATYVAAFETDIEVPPTNLLAAGVHRPAPYIYTPAEVAALMAATGRLSPPLRAASFQTLIGLLAATGLRTAEAVRLEPSDVDVRGRTLLIRDTKFGKTRQVPLHESTSTALASYARRRNRLCPRPASPRFLVSHTGGQLNASARSRTFPRLLADAGIVTPAGRRPPRLRDLRHTFAVMTLLGWHADGLDVQARLPVLSTYLGHVDPSSTYWYLQAVPELMTVVADRLERFHGVGR